MRVVPRNVCGNRIQAPKSHVPTNDFATEQRTSHTVQLTGLKGPRSHTRGPYYFLRDFGSSASLTPSPMKFTDSTVRKIAAAGNHVSHQ